MTIIWEPITNPAKQYGLDDETGNYFSLNFGEQTVSCRTPDGFLGHSFTIKDALAAAIEKREGAARSYLPRSITLLAPSTMEADDISYWTCRADKLLGCYCKIIRDF